VKDDSNHERGRNGPLRQTLVSAADVEAWFLREVLPLEASLMGYFKRNWRNESDARDLVQEVYVHACEAAQQDLPRTARPFVFTIARNLLIDRFRNLAVVPLETVGDVETLTTPSDQPGPDRNVIARDELRRLQSALDKLAPRCREAVLLRQLEGLSRREVAARMGISEETVKEYLATGLFMLSDIFFGQSAGEDSA